MFNGRRTGFFAGIITLTVFLWTGRCCLAQPPSVIVGNVRVQLLGDSLVRLEGKGSEGFEDRPTFHIVNRDWPDTVFSLQTNAAAIEIRAAGYTVRVPIQATSLDNVTVLSTNGEVLYRYDGRLTNNAWLPAPSDQPQVWSFADTPRIVPPKWGLTPQPSSIIHHPSSNSGWDLGNNAPDVYVFVPHGDYFQLRRDFLKLTGPSEMPPLYTFGAWDSRWYDYSEATALKQIDDYRAHNLPLDNLVVDTGWREGASTGYQPNTNLFPDVKRFLAEAHAKHVHVMFNDHPEPVSANALDAAELDYRFNGLSTLLDEGLDVWWYDRNWRVHLVPVPGLNKEVWGMRLYHDTTARVRPDERPLIMANVDGIDNSMRKRPMDVAAHRYPIQWTGDIGPDYEFLRRAVENAVFSGAQSLFPYESDDLGGHIANPTPEGYIRWIEYGALSPVYRPHCTHNLERMPWTFGPDAETVARKYENLRYRLLPVFYAAAHENYETGEPLLRRLDLYYPQFPEAQRNDEYLLGQYILVAPVLEGSTRNVPGDWFTALGGEHGLHGEYFANPDLAGTAAFSRLDKAINFNWDRKSPAPGFPRTNFSARWTGTILVPASVGDVTLSAMEDDGARVWIDGQLILDAWGPHDSATTTATATLTAGTPHQIRVEYQQFDFNARLRLMCQPVKAPLATREAWIPPGQWRDAWDGTVVTGPMLVTNRVPLDQIPMWIKSGAVLPLAPEMDYTGQKPWDPITLDVYPAPGATNSAALYEDDTLSTAYQRGKFRTTEIACSADDATRTVRVDIGAAAGTFQGALKKRAWIVRVHLPANWGPQLLPSKMKINGRTTELKLHPVGQVSSAMPFCDPTGAPDRWMFDIDLPATSVTRGQLVEIQYESPFLNATPPVR